MGTCCPIENVAQLESIVNTWMLEQIMNSLITVYLHGFKSNQTLVFPKVFLHFEQTLKMQSHIKFILIIRIVLYSALSRRWHRYVVKV